jgi:hypothetical protein
MGDKELASQNEQVKEEGSAPAPQDKPTVQEPAPAEAATEEVKMKLVVRSDFWGRKLSGKWFRDPQNPSQPYRLIVAQAVTEQKGRFWGCCPQAGARVLEITETHFQDQKDAGEVWDLFHMNSVPTAENLMFHNLMLLPHNQIIIDTERKMYEEGWQLLGSINASMARMDLEPLLKSFLEPNENLDFHTSHVHLLIMMDKATDRPEVRKQKDSRNEYKTRKRATGRAGTPSGASNNSSSSSIKFDGETAAEGSTRSSGMRGKPETIKRSTPSPTTLTTVGSIDSSETPSIVTQVSAFSTFQPSLPSAHSAAGYPLYYGQQQQHNRRPNHHSHSSNLRNQHQQQNNFRYSQHHQPLNMMIPGIMVHDPNQAAAAAGAYYHHPSASYYPASAAIASAPQVATMHDPSLSGYGYAPPHVGHLSPYASSYHHHSTTTSTMLLNQQHQHQLHHHQQQHQPYIAPWSSSSIEASLYGHSVAPVAVVNNHNRHPSNVPLASPAPALSADHHHQGWYNAGSTTASSAGNNNASPASTPTSTPAPTALPKTPSPEGDGSSATPTTSQQPPQGDARPEEAESEEREEKSSGEHETIAAATAATTSASVLEGGA